MKTVWPMFVLWEYLIDYFMDFVCNVWPMLPCLALVEFEASYFKMTRIQPCLTLHGHSGWRQKGGDNPHYVNPIQLMDFRVSIKFKPNPLESHFPLLLSYLLPTLGRKCMIIVKEIKVHLSLRTVKNRLTL